jgi:hypothetical protein
VEAHGRVCRMQSNVWRSMPVYAPTKFPNYHFTEESRERYQFLLLSRGLNHFCAQKCVFVTHGVYTTRYPSVFFMFFDFSVVKLSIVRWTTPKFIFRLCPTCSKTSKTQKLGTARPPSPLESKGLLPDSGTNWNGTWVQEIPSLRFEL